MRTEHTTRSAVVGAVCALLAGCASTPPAAHDLQPDEIAYTIQLEQPLAVRVHVDLYGSAEGQSELAVNEGWGGARDAGADLDEVRVRATDGRTLDVEHPEADRWIVHHAPSEQLQVDYRIAPNGHRADADPNVHYLPLLDEKLFHMIGELGLLAPSHLDASAPRRIDLVWSGFREHGWRTVSSFAAEIDHSTITRSLQDFRHAVFMAGEVRVIRRDIRGSTLTLAVGGEGWSFEESKFADLATRIVAAQRAFFEDFDYPYFLISLIPVGFADAHSSSLGGTGLTQSFALFMQPDTTLEPMTDAGMSVTHLLAHEMFHHWNGEIIEREEPDAATYWFSEGFTEFYARRLAYRAGEISAAEFTRTLNADLELYGTSPVLRAPNSTILDRFWSDPDVQKLPYRRGDALAIWLDHMIRTRTKGAQSLDDFMRELVRDARAGAPKLDNDRLLDAIARWTDASAAESARRVVVDGELVELAPDSFAPCLQMELHEAAAFDMGFEFARSQAEHSIRGLRPDSAAARAGLVEGQRLAGFSVELGRADKEVEIQVEDGGMVRTTRYLPQGLPVAVPRFTLRANSTPGECACL